MGRPALGRRFFGVPWLWAVAHSAVAFSVYYSLGVVADNALALTPVVFAVAGLIYVVTTMTYVEGGAMYGERGGSNTLARYAFNELVSFVAGWAILIDYVIVIALAAITVPHYLGPISSEFTDGSGEAIVAVAVVLVVAAINIIGYTGSRRQGLLVAMTAADLLLQVLLVVVGAIVVWDPSALTDSLDAFGAPSIENLATALVISMVAVAGIEASSDLAPDLAWRRVAPPIVAGDSVAFQWVRQGTNTGDWGDGTKATGKAFEVRGSTILRLHDYKILYQGDYYDPAAMKRPVAK